MPGGGGFGRRIRTFLQGGRPSPASVESALHGTTTERLLLRRPLPSDAEAFAATIDEDVVRINGWTADHAAHNIRSIARPELYGPQMPRMLITGRRAHEVLGSLEVSVFSSDGRGCEVGWWLAPFARGHGYATEAVDAAFRALHSAGIHRIVVGTGTGNAAVQRIMAKVGAVQEPSRPHRLPNGEVVESLWFVHVFEGEMAIDANSPSTRRGSRDATRSASGAG